jgi:prevent-host-death family protein
MKTVEMADAIGSLSDYARKARKEPWVVTVNGKPVVALMPVAVGTDLENLAVTTHPKFQAIMARSHERYEAEGGRSTEEVRRRLVVRRRALRKTPRKAG